MNRDGWVTRNEWNMGTADFTRLDVNRDNRISRFEFENDTAEEHTTPGTRQAEFNTFDANRDGWLTRTESRMSSAEFDRFDTNSDNRISRFEFENVAAATPADAADRSPAWRIGQTAAFRKDGSAGREDLRRQQRMGSRRPARARAGRFGLHAAGRHVERLSGRLSRGFRKPIAKASTPRAPVRRYTPQAGAASRCRQGLSLCSCCALCSLSWQALQHRQFGHHRQDARELSTLEQFTSASAAARSGCISGADRLCGATRRFDGQQIAVAARRHEPEHAIFIFAELDQRSHRDPGQTGSSPRRPCTAGRAPGAWRR